MIAFEPRDLFMPYQDRNFEELSRRILASLDNLRATPMLSLADAERATLNRFMNTFLTIFVQPEIGRAHV